MRDWQKDWEMSQAATPGPWKYWGYMPTEQEQEPDRRYLENKDRDSANNGIEAPNSDVIIPWDYEGYSSGMYIKPEDARFICESREALPYWLQQVKELEARVQELEAQYNMKVLATLTKLQDEDGKYYFHVACDELGINQLFTDEEVTRGLTKVILTFLGLSPVRPLQPRKSGESK